MKNTIVFKKMTVLLNLDKKNIVFFNNINTNYKIKENQIILYIVVYDNFFSSIENDENLEIENKFDKKQKRMELKWFNKKYHCHSSLDIKNIKLPFILLGYIYYNKINNKNSFMNPSMQRQEILDQTHLLYVYLDDKGELKTISKAYLNNLYNSKDMMFTLAIFFSQKKDYVNTYYNFIDNPNYPLIQFIKLDETVKHKFNDVKCNVIKLKNVKSLTYCIDNVINTEALNSLSKYMLSDKFNFQYTERIRANPLAGLLGFKKLGDFTDLYNKYMFFYMLELKAIQIFRNWLLDIAEKIKVNVYVSLYSQSAQINIMSNQTYKNMNLGIHIDTTTASLKEMLPPIIGNRKYTSRTIVLYINLNPKNNNGEQDPIIGLSTKITSNDTSSVEEYDIHNICKQYNDIISLKTKINEIIEKINYEFKKLEEKNSLSRNIIRQSINLNLIMSHQEKILIISENDPLYKHIFGILYDKLNKNNEIISEIINIILNNYKDIIFVPSRQIEETINKILELIYPKQIDFLEKLDNFIKSYKGIDIKVELNTYLENMKDVNNYISFMTDINNYKIDKLDEIIKIKELKNLFIQFYNWNSQKSVVSGKACDFINGGLVYFNSQDYHTIEAGIGKRSSIVFKVFYVDKNENEVETIDMREEKVFKDIIAINPLHNTKLYQSYHDIKLKPKPKLNPYNKYLKYKNKYLNLVKNLS